jgi:hypothetical protein
MEEKNCEGLTQQFPNVLSPAFEWANFFMDGTSVQRGYLKIDRPDDK